LNASVHLLEKTAATIVGVHSQVPPSHASTAVGLGTDRRASGILIDANGLILTVNYALMGAESIIVTLGNGDQLKADIVAHDYSTGLGLIKIDGNNYPFLKTGSSAGCELGQDVYIVASVGNESRCADSGLITYIGPFDALWEFVLDRCIMTSAMNSGLGGGALCNTRGELIAICYLNMIDIGRSGLAVPAEYFSAHRDELIKNGRRTSAPSRAWVGLLSYTLREHVVIAGVMPGGPGDKAGLKPGDVVLAVDGREINERRALYDALCAHLPGEDIQMKIFRNNQVQTVVVPGIRIEDYFG
jgi:S1-C subfamily serine protease